MALSDGRETGAIELLQDSAPEGLWERMGSGRGDDKEDAKETSRDEAAKTYLAQAEEMQKKPRA